MLCFDLTVQMQEHIRRSLFQSGVGISTASPFSLHTLVLGHIVKNFDRAVWSWRDIVRAIEKSRSNIENGQHEYVRTHEIARHIIQSSEMLAITLSLVDGIVQEFESHPTTLANFESSAIRRTFDFHKSMLKCLHLRSQALEQRLRNEINLVSLTTAAGLLSTLLNG